MHIPRRGVRSEFAAESWRRWELADAGVLLTHRVNLDSEAGRLELSTTVRVGKGLLQPPRAGMNLRLTNQLGAQALGGASLLRLARVCGSYAACGVFFAWRRAHWSIAPCLPIRFLCSPRCTEGWA